MTVPVLVATSEVPVDQLAARKDVLVLGPSLGTTAQTWDGALAELLQQHAVVRFDLPGHGKSPVATASFTLAELAEGVVNMMDALGVKTFDYAGVSVSGALSLELALRFPERVTHIIPICTGAKLGEADVWNERAEVVRREGTVVMVAVQEERWFSPDFREDEREAVQTVLDQIAAADDDSYGYLCEAIGQFDARGFLADITVPTMVISGELDPATPPAAGAAIANGIPGATQQIVPGAFHQAVVEHPLVVARMINAFLV